jgi:hypothetical protein
MNQEKEVSSGKIESNDLGKTEKHESIENIERSTRKKSNGDCE